MKTYEDPRCQFSQSELKNSGYSTEELEKMEQAIKDCQKNKTSKYMIVKGKPYLITPNGVMLYEGTTTVVYSQSQQSEAE